MALNELYAVWTPRVISVLRIMTGLLFLQHGTAKYLGIPAMPNFTNVQVMSLSGIAGLIELVAGVLLTLGLFTRPVAFICSGMTAVAYFIAHAPRGFYPLANGGELAVLYCFVFLFLAVAGAGLWSADAMLRDKQ